MAHCHCQENVSNGYGEGKTPAEIAEIFTAEKILIPRAYVAKTYGTYQTGYDTRYPYDWMGNTVASILRSKPYIGTLVNHRRTSKSFKNKKIIQIPEDEWIEVENTHEAIIDRETWDIVQKMVAVKKRPNKDGVSQIFAGLVKCPDCGRALSYKSEHTRILRVALSTITPRTKARNTVLGTISHTKLCTKLF